jgi:hypothetical protein
MFFCCPLPINPIESTSVRGGGGGGREGESKLCRVMYVRSEAFPYIPYIIWGIELAV